jgi:hypothetical protein
MGIEDFAGKRPQLLPEEYLAGPLEGWGIVESVLGSLQKRFTVSAIGKRDGRTLTFTEVWTFDDGLVDTLNWVIQRLPDGSYTGRESMLDGVAEGEQAGFAFHWKYTRETPQKDGSSTKLNFDDWFYRIDERVVCVRGSAGRAGIPFFTVHLTYRRTD